MGVKINSKPNPMAGLAKDNYQAPNNYIKLYIEAFIESGPKFCCATE